jgi:Alcohol dehydrogenase transcription factor Myb/SANT-like
LQRGGWQPSKRKRLASQSCVALATQRGPSQRLKMATQQLDQEIISQVRRHTCLYDPRQADYKDADRKAAVWRELAARLGISGKKTCVTPSIQWLHFVCSCRVRAPLALPQRSLHAPTQAKKAGTRRTESRLAAGAAHALHSGFHQTPQVATFHCRSPIKANGHRPAPTSRESLDNRQRFSVCRARGLAATARNHRNQQQRHIKVGCFGS